MFGKFLASCYNFSELFVRQTKQLTNGRSHSRVRERVRELQGTPAITTHDSFIEEAPRDWFECRKIDQLWILNLYGFTISQILIREGTKAETLLIDFAGMEPCPV